MIGQSIAYYCIKKLFESVTKLQIINVKIPRVAILNRLLINDDVIMADLLARTTIFIIKLRLITELGVEGCGSDYNPVVQ